MDQPRDVTPRERVVAAYKGQRADRVPAYPIAGSQVAWARVAVILLMMPIFIWGLCATVPIGYGEVLAQFWRPALSSACMAIIVIGLSPYFSSLPPVADLALRTVAGAASSANSSCSIAKERSMTRSRAGCPCLYSDIVLSVCASVMRNRDGSILGCGVQGTGCRVRERGAGLGNGVQG